METKAIFLPIEELECIVNLTRKCILIQDDENLQPGTVIALVNEHEHPADGAIKTILIVISDIQNITMKIGRKLQVCSFHICQITHYSLAN